MVDSKKVLSVVTMTAERKILDLLRFKGIEYTSGELVRLSGGVLKYDSIKIKLKNLEETDEVRVRTHTIGKLSKRFYRIGKKIPHTSQLSLFN